MGRKKQLKSGTVDLIKAKEDRAETAKNDKKPTKAQRDAEFSRKALSTIIGEQTTEINPLVIDYLGEKTPVVDLMGIWPTRTPHALKSASEMILHVWLRKSPRFMAVLDLETWKFRAGVLHHAIAIRFQDDNEYLTKDDFEKVEFLHSYSEITSYLENMMGDLIVACMKDPDGSNEAKVYAHNGARFDFVGLALHLGLDRNTGVWREIEILNPVKSEMVKVKLQYRITTHAGKSSITISGGKGVGGQWRLKLIDSSHILTARLADLGDGMVKGITPDQFTNPIAWINRQKSSDGEYFDIKEREVRPFLYRAHKYSLDDFETRLKPKAFEAMKLWLSVIEDRRYSCEDVIILVNALKRFASKVRDLARPLADLLGNEAVDSINPFAFNTSSTLGFALSVGYWYESRLERNDAGIVVMKHALRVQQKNRVYGKLTSGFDFGEIVEEAEANRLVAEDGYRVFSHGLIPKGVNALIEYPVHCSSWDNRFSRMAQHGSQTTVFMPVAKKVKELDINSSFPASMARGVEKLVQIPHWDRPVICNALKGYEDPGQRQGVPTMPMRNANLVTCEYMVNELGEEVAMLVVRGRKKILEMLQSRNGEFTSVLPPSAVRSFDAIPAVPLRTSGKGLDSRLLYARIATPSLFMIRGEYLAYYLSEPTLCDEAAVVYLSEHLMVNGQPTQKGRDRSRHGPIMGVSVDPNGVVFGKPHLPHEKFFGVMYNTRLGEKKRAKAFAAQGDMERASNELANAAMTKLIMNGGGYGTYGQNKRPETDFNLEVIDECVEVIESISGLDPLWRGMAGAIKRLAPDYDLDEEVVTWSDLYSVIESYREARDKAEKDLETAISDGNPKVISGKRSIVSTMRIHWLAAVKTLFHEWADNQITSFTVHPYTSPELDDEGRRVTYQRGIMTSTEETAPHAIRPYASAVVAKSAVLLHQGQVNTYNSPFKIANSDTDSVHVDTGSMPDYFNSKAVWLELAELFGEDRANVILDEGLEYAIDIIRGDTSAKSSFARCARIVADNFSKNYQSKPSDYDAALHRLMNDTDVDTDSIFKDIMVACGMDVGEGLGQWGLESHTYDAGMAPGVTKSYQSETTYYLAPKVYVDLDGNNNVARAKVRSVPKVNPLQPAVFQGHNIGIPSLADRRGLDQEVFRQVKLDDRRQVVLAGKKMYVESFFSSPRRRYFDTNGSIPFELKMPAALSSKILSGKKISAITMSSEITRQFGIDENLENIRGLQDAYLQYQSSAKIQGMSFSNARKIVSEATDRDQQLVSFKLSENLDDDESHLIAMPGDEDYDDYMKEIYEEHVRNGGSHDDLVPF